LSIAKENRKHERESADIAGFRNVAYTMMLLPMEEVDVDFAYV
jgi:hypothetical protein